MALAQSSIEARQVEERHPGEQRGHWGLGQGTQIAMQHAESIAATAAAGSDLGEFAYSTLYMYMKHPIATYMSLMLPKPTILVRPASRKMGTMPFVMFMYIIFSRRGGSGNLAEEPVEAPLGTERMVAGALSIEAALL